MEDCMEPSVLLFPTSCSSSSGGSSYATSNNSGGAADGEAPRSSYIEAFLDELIHVDGGSAAATAPRKHLDMRFLLASDATLAFRLLVKVSNSIQEIHQEVTFLFMDKAGVGISFRPIVLQAYLALQGVTQIAEFSIVPHPDNLFVILRMYTPASDLFNFAKHKFLPILEELSIDNTSNLSARFDSTLQMLAGMVRSTLQVLKTWIADYTFDEIARGGIVHKITKYLMTYIKLLLEHSSLLNIILVDDKQEPASVRDIVGDLIYNLEAMLQKRSRLYRVPELQCLFLLNNTYFILQQVEGSEMRTLLGDDCVLEHMDQIENYISMFLDISWTPVLSCFLVEAKRIPISWQPLALTRFNVKFEDTYRDQKEWKIEDPLLRKRMRGVVTEMLVPAYRSYLEKHPNKLQKYTPEELEEKLSELFEG